MRAGACLLVMLLFQELKLKRHTRPDTNISIKCQPKNLLKRPVPIIHTGKNTILGPVHYWCVNIVVSQDLMKAVLMDP